ncbi:APC family permease [Ferrimonas pelagia]|uniref:APC family permease n=1 Tax=Ferrimonas pelagia TaxID=1177826 RepID=UPI0031E5A2F4
MNYLSSRHALAISVGSIIGWGAFVLPGDLFLPAGGFVGSSLALLFGALLILLVSSSYAFMSARRLSAQQSALDWVIASLGRKHAFFYGWGVALGYVSIVALNVTALPLLFRFVADDLLHVGYLYTSGGWEVYLLEIMVCAVVLLALGIINARGVSLGASSQLGITAVMVTAMGVIFLMSLYQAPSLAWTAQEGVFAIDRSGFWAIVAITPWAFVGFETIPQISKYLRSRRANVALLLTASVLIGTLLYLLVNYATFALNGFDPRQAEAAAWATGDGVFRHFGMAGMLLLTLAMGGAILAGINGFLMVSARMLSSMASAGLLPEAFARQNAGGAAYVGVWFGVLFGLGSIFLGRHFLLNIVDMASMGITIGFLYVSVVAFKARRAAGQRAWLGVVSILISLGFCALLLLPGSPAQLSGASQLLLLLWWGIGATLYWRRIGRAAPLCPATEC